MVESCPDCGYTGLGLNSYHINCPTPKKYETLLVDDSSQKLQRLVESQDRQITRLESEIERLQERIVQLESSKPVPYPAEEFVKVDDSVLRESNTLPKGIQLKSEFRDGLEKQLREKHLTMKENK